jgi:hypothetical protein
MRRSPIAVLATTLVLLSTMLVAAGTASAKKPRRIAASGTISVVSNTVSDTVESEGDTIVTAVAVVNFAGTLVGRATEPYIAVTSANGAVLQIGTGAFTGTVAGRTGSIFYVFRGDATSGVITFTRGTGGLRGVRGRLTYELASTSPTAVFNYRGAIRFRSSRR